MKNVPLVADVVGDNYSADEYYQNEKKYGNQLKEQFVSVTNSQGKTVGYDQKEGAVFIMNPGSADVQSAVKENVGVKTRIGFTYGKYRGKIKFPLLLNKTNMWNGITCAFWLLYQGEGDWNMRGPCEGAGYIPKYEFEKTSHRERINNYSEIDIEIVKTSRYWPKSSYGNARTFPTEDASKNHDIIVACTNWDLACQEPADFNVGVRDIKYDGQTFGLHRWDYWYKALTSKYSTESDDVVGTEMYFEIDWQPEQIIWRMGKSKDNMKVIGYMNSRSTKIPDNQMITVVSQEFHDGSWWPPAPWFQDNIPFPKNDLKGYVYELEVE